jgi:hypothetical protein
MSAAVIFTGRLQGQTSAGAAIQTVNPVEILSTGDLRFTAWNGQQMVIESGSCDPAVMHLFRTLFIGTGGPATTGRGPFFGAE